MIGEFVKVTLATWGATARTLLAQLRAAGSEGADDAAEAFDAVEVLQPLGLRANPVLRATTEALVIERGDERLVIHLVDKSRQAGAVEPEAGGVTVHSLATQSAVIYWRADGSIEITAAAGRDVTVNGGTLKVGRFSDPVAKNATLGTWMGAVETALNTLAPGSVVTLSTTFSNVATIADGAARFKA